MKEQDKWWNIQKKQRRVENVNLCNGSRVNGKPLYEGQPRTPQIDAKIKRRELLKKALPWTIGGVAGAVTGKILDNSGNLSQAVQDNTDRLNLHEKVLINHQKVLLLHDRQIATKQDKL